MLIFSSNHRLLPPSHNPRTRGSLSTTNDPLANYLDNSLHCLELSLPESRHMLVLAEIEYRSLSARMDTVVRSAKEFSAFRIRGHGITAQELQKMEEEAQEVATWNGSVVIPCVRSRHGTLYHFQVFRPPFLSQLLVADREQGSFLTSRTQEREPEMKGMHGEEERNKC